MSRDKINENSIEVCKAGVRGMHSHLNASHYYAVYDAFWAQARLYGCCPVKLSAVYPIEWFSGAGNASDVCSKEMISVAREIDGKSIGALAPEYTAPFAKMLESIGGPGHLGQDRFAYFERAYRYNRPQSGRFREFTQCGWECYGDAFSEFDIIYGAYQFLKSVGWSDVQLKINTIGTEAEQSEYAELLRKQFVEFTDPDLQSKLTHSSLRLLDALPQEKLVALPTWELSAETTKEFGDLCKQLDLSHVPYEISRTLVRGLDYYEKTVFEFHTPDTNQALLSGGRYDRITRNWSNPSRAFGWAAGVERIMQRKYPNFEFSLVPWCLCFDFVHWSDCVNQLRAHNIPVKTILITNYSQIKRYLARALKAQVQWMIILGENETTTNTISYKDIKTNNSEQQVPIEKFMKNYLQSVSRKIEL